jgi:hypothetical protein
VIVVICGIASLALYALARTVSRRLKAIADQDAKTTETIAARAEKLAQQATEMAYDQSRAAIAIKRAAELEKRRQAAHVKRSGVRKHTERSVVPFRKAAR